jgi:hypothetical protein
MPKKKKKKPKVKPNRIRHLGNALLPSFIDSPRQYKFQGSIT